MTKQNENERAETPQGSVEAGAVVAEPLTPANVPHAKRRTIFIAASLVGVVAVSLLAFWFWTAQRSGAGRPVPAPKAIESNQPLGNATLPSAEPTVMLSQEVAERAGIRIEGVAEQQVTGGEASGGTVATGVVQVDSYRSTPVVSLVGGILRQVNAELGQNLRRGQTVAVVFSDDLAMTQTRYLVALADLEEHHQHHKRVVALVEIGAVSHEELEQTTTKLLTAESAVAAQRQRLLLLGLSSKRIDGLNSASQVSSEVSMPAPVTGTVITRSANPGEVIEANKEILRIADLSSVWVIGQVYEKDLGRIRVGSVASISSESYPGRLFRGQVTYIDPNLDQATRTAQVRIELSNPGQLLKLGMYVDIAFASPGGSSTVPSIPAAAVQQVNNQQVAFVATNESGVYAMRPLRLGPEVNGRYQVLEGLNVGDRIVTEGSFLLRAEWLKLNATVISPATDHNH
jgi:membrane fusion protein, heavy metal efflux system